MSSAAATPRPNPAELTLLRPASRRIQFHVLSALAVLAGLRLWILPLGSSLWLDELVTYWSAYKGVMPSIGRSQFWPGQNMAYTLLISALIRVAGSNEIVLRLPSVVATVFTAWLLFRLAQRFVDTEAGILVVIVFVSLHEIAQDAATNARPYAIALMLVVAATLQLVRWLDTQRPLNLLGFILTAAAIPYFHLLFTTSYLVFLVYSTYIWGSKRQIKIRNLLSVAVLIGVLVAPLAWNTLRGHRPSAESSFAGTPDLQLLSSSLMPLLVSTTLFVAALAAYFSFRGFAANSANIPRTAGVLFVSWLMLPVVTLFLVAFFTPLKIFVPRYYLASFAALALVIGCGLRSITPVGARILIAGFIVLGSIISSSGYPLPTSLHGEDWRAAAQIVRASHLPANTPLLLRVGLIETARVQWGASIEPDSPLLCPLSKYPMPGKVTLIPRNLDPASFAYLEEISSHILTSADTFLVVARNDENSIPWIRGWLFGQGFEPSKLGNSQGVSVLVCHRLRH